MGKYGLLGLALLCCSQGAWGHSSMRYGMEEHHRRMVGLSPREAPTPGPRTSFPGTFHTHTQKLDHFDPLNEETFQQRYYVDDSRYVAGGPVMFVMSGEEDLEGFIGFSPSIATWTYELNGTMVMLEHRYYGGTKPVPNITRENLRWLTIEQAMSDAAEFVAWYSPTLPPNPKTGEPSKWVAIGASYSASLSTWFRLKFPNLVVGAYGASNVNLAKVDFKEYVGHLKDVASPSCSARLKRGARAIELKMAGMTPTELADYGHRAFNVCRGYPLNADNMYFFKWSVNLAIASMCQEDYPPYYVVKHICKATMAANSDEEGFIKGWEMAKWASNNGRPVGCGNYEPSLYVKYLSNPEWVKYTPRTWYWQKCTQMGYFKTSHGPEDPDTTLFSNLTLPQMLTWCSAVFGPLNPPEADRINREYGGAKSLDTTNVVMSEGLFDPWSELGVRRNYSQPGKVTSTFFYSAGHIAPLFNPAPTDPENLTQSRIFIMNQIEKFLSG